MKILTILILVFSCSTIGAQSGIQFFEGSWEKALETAKQEHKIIFMDAFAEWCGPCKRMAKEVFTQKEVGDFYNKHFINVKMDMEKGEGPKLAAKYKVTAYPTLFYIDGSGEIVNVQVGGVNADQLLGLGKVALNKNDKSKNYAAEYENGNRDPEMLKAYAYSLLVSGQPSLKIANEFIKTQGNVYSDAVLEFIYDFANEADCSIFDKLIQNKSKIIQIKGEEIFKNKIQKACDVTIDKAVDFQTPELLEEAKKQMKSALPAFSAEYNLLADIRYSQKIKNLKNSFNASDRYVSQFGKKNPDKIIVLIQFFIQNTNDPKILNKVEKWASTVYSAKKNKNTAKIYSELLKKNGKLSESKKIEEAAKTLPAE